jgi:hypothetical protein
VAIVPSHDDAAERVAALPEAAPATAVDVVAALAAGPLTAAQTLALQRSVGNRAATRLLSRSDSDESSRSGGEPSRYGREGEFALKHPLITQQIYGTSDSAETRFPSTSSLAIRFSVNLHSNRQTEISKEGLSENESHEGSEVNAMRHTFWNAINTVRFGADIAKEAADAHEADPYAIDNKDPATQTFLGLSAADQGVDLRNNIIGRAIGGDNLKATKRELAAKVLDTFRNAGLWIAVREGDSKLFVARRTQITQATYEAAKKKLANLNELGLTPEGAKHWQEARDLEEQMDAAGLPGM